MLSPVSINAAVARAKRDQKSQLLTVDTGLILRINKKGIGLWCAKTKLNGKTYNTSFGHYPDVSVATARQMKNDWIRGIRLEDNSAGENYTLQQAYEEWSERKRVTLYNFNKLESRFKMHILPLLGHRKLKDLTAYTFIQAWKPLEEQGKIPTLQALSSDIRQLAIFVQNTGRVGDMHDLTHISQNYVRTKPVEHRIAVTPAELPDIFYTLEHNGCPHGMPWHVFMGVFYTLGRSSEVSAMKWSWVDFDAKVIRFPAESMKMKRPHDVPMSTQLITLLESLPRVNECVFSSNSATGHVDHTSANVMMFRYGLRGRQCIHGIRSIGSSWMAENDVPEEVAEACLAHASGNTVRRAYQRSELLEKRRPVMQAWCDYVEQCRLQALERIKAETEK